MPCSIVIDVAKCPLSTLIALYFEYKKDRQQDEQFITKKMLLIDAAELSDRLARM